MGTLFKLFIILFLTSISCYGQEKSQKENKLKLKSVTAGFGIYSTDLRDDVDYFDYDQAGLTLSAGLSVLYKKHIFSLDVDLGTNIGVIFLGENDGESSYFNSYDILYGRELNIFKWLRVETHVGLGLYVYKNRLAFNSSRYERKEVLGTPVDLRLMIDFYKRFVVGLNPEVNFNSINTTYMGSVVFQYKFN